MQIGRSLTVIHTGAIALAVSESLLLVAMLKNLLPQLN